MRAWFIQAVAAQHATNGVGDQLSHRVMAEASPLFLFSKFATVAACWVHSESYLVDCNFVCDFIGKAVGINKKPIVFFFRVASPRRLPFRLLATQALE